MSSDSTAVVSARVRRKRRRAKQRDRGTSAPLLPRSVSRRVVEGLLVIAVLGAVLTVGSVHVPMLVLWSAVALAACALTLVTGYSRSRRIPAPAILAFALAGYTLLQAVPMPFAWLRVFDPRGADLWHVAFQSFGDGPPALASVSLDPGASFVEALKWFTYGAIVVTTSAVARVRGIRWGATILLLAGTVVALATIGHGAVDATRVFGIYEPRVGGERWHIGPLLNPNNLAGYLNLTALAGLGILTERDARIPRWVVALSIATMVGASMVSGSRGGLAGLVIGLFLFSLALRRSARSNGRLRSATRIVPWALATIAVGAALALTAARQETVDALLQKDFQKIEMIGWIVPLLRDHPWLGVGRGAFESTFQHYRLGPDDIVYTHTENLVTQWATEWGIPVATAGLVAAFSLLRPRRFALSESTTATGLYCGLLALVAQNLVDLSLEVPGVTFAAATVVGVLWGGARVASAAPEPGASSGGLRGAAVLAAGTILAVLAASIGKRTLIEDRDDALIDFPKASATAAEYAAYRAELREHTHRHPAEPYFPRTAALAAWRGHTENPWPLLVYALERAPGSGRTHFFIAIFLAQRGFENQSLLELRYATRYASFLAAPGARLAWMQTHDPDALMRAVPEGRDGARILVELAQQAAPPELLAAQDHFLAEATARDPTLVAARRLAVSRLLAVLETPDGTGRCTGDARAACARSVARHCDALEQLLPGQPDATVLRGRLLMAIGQPQLAAKTLAARCESFAERRPCLRIWLLAAATAHDLPTARKVAELLQLDGCAGTHKCATTCTQIADILVTAGDPVGALGYYEKAARDEPSPGRSARAGDAATTIADSLLGKGQTADALKYLERAASIDPNLTRWRRLATLKSGGSDTASP